MGLSDDDLPELGSIGVRGSGCAFAILFIVLFVVAVWLWFQE